MNVPKVKASESSDAPLTAAIAKRGVSNGREYAQLFSALMSDLLLSRVTPSVGNATCNAGGKLLKVVEMTHKYGTRAGKTGQKLLLLTAAGGQ